MPDVSTAVAAPSVESSPTSVEPVEGAAPAVETPKVKSGAWVRLRRAEKAAKDAATRETAWQAERGQLTGQLQEFQGTAAQLKAELEAIKSNPLEWAAKHGVDPNSLVRKHLEAGTPEAKIEEALAEATKTKREFEEWKAAQKKSDEDKASAANVAALDRIVQQNLQMIRANKKEWPYTNLVMGEELIIQKIRQLHDYGVKNKETYTIQEVKNAFEKFAKARWDRMSEEAKELLTESPAAQGQTTGAPPAKGQASRQPTPAKNASTPPTPPKVPKTRVLSREQQREADIAALRAAIAKDKAASKPPAPRATKH